VKRAWVPPVVALLALGTVIGWWLRPASSPDDASLPPDKLGVRLARDCPCGDAASSPISDIGLFVHIRDLVGANPPRLDLGNDIPAAELPLTLLYRAIDDGLASGQRLTLLRATRRPDLGRSFLHFDVERDHHFDKLYVLDDVHDRICCKADISTYLEPEDLPRFEDVPANADR
jgi:hypothetical protein